MDKCACSDPEYIAGVLKTIYLFLEGHKFHQTCETFLLESEDMGILELKKSIARVLVLKPSLTEIVKVSHAYPEKTESQMAADILLPHTSSSSKPVDTFLFCCQSFNCSASAPSLMDGECHCTDSTRCCELGGFTIVEAMDRTRDDVVKQKIFKRAEEKVELSSSPSHQTQQDEHRPLINFKPTPIVIEHPPELLSDTDMTISEKDLVDSSTHSKEEFQHYVPGVLSKSFPQDYTQQKHYTEAEKEEMTTEEISADELEAEEMRAEELDTEEVCTIELDNQMTPADEEKDKNLSGEDDIHQLDNQETHTDEEKDKNLSGKNDLHQLDNQETRMDEEKDKNLPGENELHRIEVGDAVNDNVEKQIFMRNNTLLQSPNQPTTSHFKTDAISKDNQNERGVINHPKSVASAPPSILRQRDSAPAVSGKPSIASAPNPVLNKKQSRVDAKKSFIEQHPSTTPENVRSTHEPSAQHSQKSFVDEKPPVTEASVESVTSTQKSSVREKNGKHVKTILQPSSQLSEKSIVDEHSPAAQLSIKSMSKPSKKSFIEENSAVNKASIRSTRQPSVQHKEKSSIDERPTLKPSLRSILHPTQKSLIDENSHSSKANIENIDQSEGIITVPSNASLQPLAGSFSETFISDGNKSHPSLASVHKADVYEGSQTSVGQCRSVPQLMEPATSDHTMKRDCNYFNLDYNRIKSELRNGCPTVRTVLLQALRWRITHAKPECRNEIIAEYTRHDLLSLHGTPSKGHKSLIEELLCRPNSEAASDNLEEGIARMVNAMASLALGRDYLCQDETLLTKLIIPLVMETHPLKIQLDQLTKEFLLVALQKLSLRNNMRLIMIEAGLAEYLVQYLSMNRNRTSDYCKEYSLALFMNLCLHSEAHARLKKKARDVVKFILDFLSSKHDSYLSYINGAMYSLFTDADIKKEAKHAQIESKISKKIPLVDEDIAQQLEVILDILDSNKQVGPCPECDCIDQDEEIDHLEDELDAEDFVDSQPNGEELLRAYQFEGPPSDPFTLPLSCLCRPVTPCKKLTAFETCIQGDGIRKEPTEIEKKSKFKRCFSKCRNPCGSKPKKKKFKDSEEPLLATEESWKSCCTEAGENIPTKELSAMKSSNKRLNRSSSHVKEVDSGTCSDREASNREASQLSCYDTEVMSTSHREESCCSSKDPNVPARNASRSFPAREEDMVVPLSKGASIASCHDLKGSATKSISKEASIITGHDREETMKKSASKRASVVSYHDRNEGVTKCPSKGASLLSFHDGNESVTKYPSKGTDVASYHDREESTIKSPCKGTSITSCRDVEDSMIKSSSRCVGVTDSPTREASVATCQEISTNNVTSGENLLRPPSKGFSYTSNLEARELSMTRTRSLVESPGRETSRVRQPNKSISIINCIREGNVEKALIEKDYEDYDEQLNQSSAKIRKCPTRESSVRFLIEDANKCSEHSQCHEEASLRNVATQSGMMVSETDISSPSKDISTTTSINKGSSMKSFYRTSNYPEPSTANSFNIQRCMTGSASRTINTPTTESSSKFRKQDSIMRSVSLNEESGMANASNIREGSMLRSSTRSFSSPGTEASLKNVSKQDIMKGSASEGQTISNYRSRQDNVTTDERGGNNRENSLSKAPSTASSKPKSNSTVLTYEEQIYAHDSNKDSWLYKEPSQKPKSQKKCLTKCKKKSASNPKKQEKENLADLEEQVINEDGRQDKSNFQGQLSKDNSTATPTYQNKGIEVKPICSTRIFAMEPCRANYAPTLFRRSSINYRNKPVNNAPCVCKNHNVYRHNSSQTNAVRHLYNNGNLNQQYGNVGQNQIKTSAASASNAMCMGNFEYPVCYRDNANCPFQNNPTGCGIHICQCKLNSQQKNKYTCECYNNMRQFVQETNVNGPTAKLVNYEQ